MDKFDVRSAKMLSIIGVILIGFVIAIANAYKYLPSETSEIPDVDTEISQPVNNSEDNYNNETEEEEEEDRPAEENTRETKSYSEPETVSYNNLTPLDNVDNDNYSADSEKTYESIIANAKQFKEEKQLVKAISEYQQAVNLAENSKQKAECYEEIATIYAISKKYGTALSFAQKAYNLSPSTPREILLARLYFKTGSTDKASDRINNVLRRDFNQDN